MTTTVREAEATTFTVRLTDEQLRTIRMALLSYMGMFTREQHMMKKVREVLAALPVMEEEGGALLSGRHDLAEEEGPDIWLGAA